MNKRILFFIAIFIGMANIVFAQPANDICSGATALNIGGCNNGQTTTGSNDSWIGSVGCQGGGQHNDVWYSFVATNNQFNFTVTGAGIGNDVEVVLAESPCGGCGCSMIIAGSSCGTAPLTDSITGLNIGATYFVTISSSGTDGGFNICSELVPAVGAPGQDCDVATNICDMSSFGQGTVASGNGVVNGGGSEEDVAAMTCFGTAERQSQWYTFTVSTSGTIEFNINPNVSGDDYDWALFDITTSGCALNSGGATVVECDWSGCKGSTGMSSAPLSEPGVVTSGSGCFGGPAAWEPPANVVCGRTYALLIDNFSLSNSGFTFTWGGATGGMTATIGPLADFSLAASGCDVSFTNNATCTTNYTYNWTFGDGTSYTGTTPPTHTYTAGTYTITLTVTDANGCTATTSQTVTVCPLPADRISFTAVNVNEHIQLDWKMPSSVEAIAYTVLRGKPGVNLSTWAEFESREQSYTMLDVNPYTGKNLYQLVATDILGQKHFSEILEVNANPGLELNIYPNPVGSEVIFTMPGEAGTQECEATVYDVTGKAVLVRQLVLSGGQNVIPATDIAPGLYWLQVKTNHLSYSARFIKE